MRLISNLISSQGTGVSSVSNWIQYVRCDHRRLRCIVPSNRSRFLQALALDSEQSISNVRYEEPIVSSPPAPSRRASSGQRRKIKSGYYDVTHESSFLSRTDVRNQAMSCTSSMEPARIFNRANLGCDEFVYCAFGCVVDLLEVILDLHAISFRRSVSCRMYVVGGHLTVDDEAATCAAPDRGRVRVRQDLSKHRPW